MEGGRARGEKMGERLLVERGERSGERERESRLR